MTEVIIVPRSFKLLDELNLAEKGEGVPPPHSTFVSLGLLDGNDMSMSKWQASMFGLNGTAIQDRYYSLLLECGDNYPNTPPKIWFRTKINMPGVDQNTGLVNPQLYPWNSKSTLANALCSIRNGKS